MHSLIRAHTCGSAGSIKTMGLAQTVYLCVFAALVPDWSHSNSSLWGYSQIDYSSHANGDTCRLLSIDSCESKCWYTLVEFPFKLVVKSTRNYITFKILCHFWVSLLWINLQTQSVFQWSGRVDGRFFGQNYYCHQNPLPVLIFTGSMAHKWWDSTKMNSFSKRLQPF